VTDPSTSAQEVLAPQMGPPTILDVSVVIITYQRPHFVRRCLDHLRAQRRAPFEVIVVDSSPGGETQQIVTNEYPEVRYAICSAGRGAMATARNIGFNIATGHVVAFLDDDAFADPDWLERLAEMYTGPEVGGVGGLADNGRPGAEVEGADRIGVVCPDGSLTGYWAANPGRPVEVDHLQGANMSFRRTAIEEIGGIRDGYRGTCFCEDTDLCLRIKRRGYHLIYTPFARVAHVGGPLATGRRWDLRYRYWAQHNHVILLVRNFGLRSALLWRYVLASLRDSVSGTGRLHDVSGKLKDGNFVGGMRTTARACIDPFLVIAATSSGLGRGVLYARSDLDTSVGGSFIGTSEGVRTAL
jgi:GT2 family glycosyltransferase